jgi:DNA helicase-2/ATP-dependent DNA helicase PcrA
VSWYRILMLLPGIGDVPARAAIDLMAQMAWDSRAFGQYRPPSRARDAHTELVALLDQLRATPLVDLASVGGDIARVRQLYDGLLREKYDNIEPRLADLDQLQTIAGGYPSREGSCSLALEPPQATQDLAGGSDEERDVLVLSTAHSAKGKEWDAVFLIWAADGWFPMARAINDDEELEEERRLMYVALTRARNHLAVSCPLNSYSTRRSADYPSTRCRVSTEVREKMERVVPRIDGSVDRDPEPAPAAAIDLRALLRGRFGA